MKREKVPQDGDRDWDRDERGLFVKINISLSGLYGPKTRQLFNEYIDAGMLFI